MQHLYHKESLYKIASSNPDNLRVIDGSRTDRLIICSQADYEQQSELMLKINSAIGFEGAGIIIIDLINTDYYPLHKLIQNPETKLILNFGLPNQTLGLPDHLKAHKLYRFETFSYCYSKSLAEIAIDQTLKKSFWTFAKQTLV